MRLCELLEPLLLHPKFQDSYFWCLRDPELQFCIKIGPGNRNIKQLLECACSSSLALQALRGTRKCEKCHFAFLARQQLTAMFPILRVQVTWAEMTAMFHQLDLEVWQICLNLLFIPLHGPNDHSLAKHRKQKNHGLTWSFQVACCRQLRGIPVNTAGHLAGQRGPCGPEIKRRLFILSEPFIVTVTIVLNHFKGPLKYPTIRTERLNFPLES